MQNASGDSQTDLEEQLETLTQEQLDALVKLHKRFLDGRLGGRRANLKNTDISGLSLKGHDLRQANFMGCVMIKMDLSNANFQEASLYGCNLNEANLNKTNFVRADLRGATIENATLVNADLENADLRVGGISSGNSFDTGQAVNFRGANLSGAKLAGSMASKADFSDAILADANMTKADLRGAMMEGADLSNAEIQGADLSGASFKAAILTGVRINDIMAASIDMTDAITDDNAGKSIADIANDLVQMIETHNVWVKSAGQEGAQLDLSDYDMRELGILENQKLTAITARNAKFLDMKMNGNELQSAVLDYSDFRHAEMSDCDFRGTSFVGANLSHAILRNGNFGSLMFGGGGATKRFNPCDLSNTKLRYANFTDSVMKGTNFKDADVSHADFSGCDLRDCDFTGAKTAGTLFENANTEGAIFDRDESRPVFRIPVDED